MHIHRDKKKTAEIETIDYLPQDSEMYRKWLHTQPLQRLWDRWMMMFLVGFVVGACAFCLHVLFSTLAVTKARRAAPRRAAAGCTPSAPRQGHSPTRRARSLAPRHPVRLADQHSAPRHRQECGPGLAVQRRVLAGAGGHLRRERAVDLARRCGLRRARGHGVPERLLAAQGARGRSLWRAALAAQPALAPHLRLTATAHRGRRCSSGRHPRSSSSPAPAAWAPACRSDLRGACQLCS